MIAGTINQKIAQAMKAKDKVRLSTLRLLSSALNYEKIAKQHDLSNKEEIMVVKREAKKRTDAVAFIKEAQGKSTTSDMDTLVKRLVQEEKELDILKEFLPQNMGQEELEKLIDKTISDTGASGLKDMGRVIGKVMQEAKGSADGSKVSEMVKLKIESTLISE